MPFRFIFVLFLIFISRCALTQDIPNYDLENWIMQSGSEIPESWDTPNSITNVAPFYVSTVTKSNDSYSGNYAARLETLSILTFNIPGLITLGDFSIDLGTMQPSIEGGISFNKRPEALNGYFKYQTPGNDSALLAIILFEGIDNDTVGAGVLFQNSNINDYQLFSIPITYYNEKNPEIINIIAISSSAETPVLNSTLFIDSLFLTYPPTQTDHRSAFGSISSFPNPFHEYIQIDINAPFKSTPLSVSIFNMFGDCVYQKNELHSETLLPLKIMTRNWKPGLYIIQVKSRGNSIQTLKIVKQ